MKKTGQILIEGYSIQYMTITPKTCYGHQKQEKSEK